jgi:hypothetical protein
MKSPQFDTAMVEDHTNLNQGVSQTLTMNREQMHARHWNTSRQRTGLSARSQIFQTLISVLISLWDWREHGVDRRQA